MNASFSLSFLFSFGVNVLEYCCRNFISEKAVSVLDSTDLLFFFHKANYKLNILLVVSIIYIFQIFDPLHLKVEFQASTDLVVSAAQVGRVHQDRSGQFRATVEWSGVAERQLSVVSEDEGVAGSACSGLFTGEREAGSGSAVADGGGELEAGVDLVVENSGEVVVEARLHGGVDLAAGPVGFELFGFDGTVEGETEFGSDVGRTVSENGISVQSALGISVHVQVNFVVAPRELDLVQSWDWASGDWPAGASGNFGNVVVLDLNVANSFGWVQSFFDGKTVAHLLFGFE